MDLNRIGTVWKLCQNQHQFAWHSGIAWSGDMIDNLAVPSHRGASMMQTGKNSLPSLRPCSRGKHLLWEFKMLNPFFVVFYNARDCFFYIFLCSMLKSTPILFLCSRFNDQSNDTFENEMKSVFKAINKLMVHKHNHLLIPQGLALKHLPSVIEDITTVFEPRGLRLVGNWFCIRTVLSKLEIAILGIWQFDRFYF